MVFVIKVSFLKSFFFNSTEHMVAISLHKILNVNLKIQDKKYWIKKYCQIYFKSTLEPIL